MQKKSNDTGANKETGIDYFEYVRNHPEEGRRISKEEMWEMIQKSREEKARKHLQNKTFSNLFTKAGPHRLHAVGEKP